MGTEEDKPNNPVLITIFVIGGAAMIGGSAAIVGMTRTEMEQQSFEMSGYADLDSVRELRDSQRKLLQESKLPIDKARDQLIADIKRNPRNASWATPEPTETAAAVGGAGGAGAVPSASASGDLAVGGAPAAGGAAPAPTADATGAPEDAPAPDAPAPDAPAPHTLPGASAPAAGSAPAPKGHEGHHHGAPSPQGTP